jgi:hypothetical protein
MKSNLKDILLIIIGVVGLYLLFEISKKENGRYVIAADGVLLDTQNGKIYFRYLKEKTYPGKPEFYWVQKYEEVK